MDEVGILPAEDIVTGRPRLADGTGKRREGSDALPFWTVAKGAKLKRRQAADIIEGAKLKGN
jgi:hypothetical protein